MRTLCMLLVLALLVTLSGCGQATQDASADDSFESPEEKELTMAGRPFARLIFKRDYAAAYDMLSSSARARVSAAEFAQMHDDARSEFFAPAAMEPARVMEMNRYILRGENDPEADELDQQVNLLSYQRYVGDVPADVPLASRRASLAAAFYDGPVDQAERACYLTYLLVEEGGKLKVAYWFYRWHDTLD